MRARVLLLGFIFLALFIPGVSGAEYNLTENQNPFNSSAWFVASNNVLRNSTLEAYELNYTGSMSYEDFTTYTEVDTNGIITINSTTIHYVGTSGEIRNNDDHRVTKAHQVRSGETFTYNMDFYLDSITNNAYTVSGAVFGLSNLTDSVRDIGTVFNDYGLFVRYYSLSSSNQFYMGINHWEAGVNVGNISAGNSLNIDTWYYLQFQKTATKYIFRIYSDSDRSVLLEEYSILLVNTGDYTYNYLYALDNTGFATGLKPSAGYIKKFSLTQGAGYSRDGVLYFKNLLENTTGEGAYYLSNNTLGGQTLQIAFSENNSTWILNTTLNEGLNSIYLRPHELNPLYVKYRFLSDGSNTPRILNASILYEGGGGGSGATVYRYGLGIVLLMIGLLLGVGIIHNE